ncbi:type II secretion system protein GspM [uncultured Paraglaciecola sp.]|uniref:type II secretion system protein GspM n=1 Tax=uncultured Paraglaciecola sp. TaxID=1765024 RepID=UPI00260206B4|nr:type II secretion system protein GspM [uncultured Paraglaciecola sp.]
MSNSFENEYNKLATKFLEVSLREQVLILLCGLVVLVLLVYTFLFEPMLNTTTRLQENSLSAKNDISTLDERTAKLTEKLNDDPNQSVNKKIALLTRQIQDITQQLETQTNTLVPANKMAGMLESVLEESQGLKLIELQSIAPEPVLAGKTAKEDDPKAGLYQHGVTLVFEGSYFDIQQYLEKLELLPWQFYWEKFDYLVGDYPTASVELEIYTLSTNKEFIGS